ncbi:MAG: thiamine phosphate synthase [Prevotella sp.]
MKLILMTQPNFFVEEDKILTTLFDEGLDNLHLNKPEASPVYSERLLSLLSDDVYSRITVHDHYYLKSEYKLAGIHIDDEDSTVPAGYKGNFSRSCYHIDRLKELKKKAEYVFLANTFNDGTNVPYSMEELRNAADNGIIDRHVYACGGVNLDNIRTAKELGFGGVVICEDLWNKFNIQHEQNYKELINHFEKLKKIIS